MSGLIALPCRDAELVIGSLIMRARQASEAVVVIDEGSTARTAEIVTCTGTPLVTRAPSAEPYDGLREAVAYATRTGADLLVVLFDDQLCRQECIARLTGPARDGTANLVIGENREGLIGLLVLDRRAIGRAFAQGDDLGGPEGMVELAEGMDLRTRRLRIPEEEGAIVAPPATLTSALLGLFTFTQPRAASAMYGSVFLSVGVGAAGWSLSSFNSTALLHAEGLVTGTALAVAGMLLVTTSLLSNSLSMIRKHQRS